MDLNGYKETDVPVFKDNCKICFLEGQKTLEHSGLYIYNPRNTGPENPAMYVTSLNKLHSGRLWKRSWAS